MKTHILPSWHSIHCQSIPTYHTPSTSVLKLAKVNTPWKQKIDLNAKICRGHVIKTESAKSYHDWDTHTLLLIYAAQMISLLDIWRNIWIPASLTLKLWHKSYLVKTTDGVTHCHTHKYLHEHQLHQPRTDEIKVQPVMQNIDAPSLKPQHIIMLPSATPQATTSLLCYIPHNITTTPPSILLLSMADCTSVNKANNCYLDIQDDVKKCR